MTRPLTPLPTGLVLDGRRALVVGGGAAAQRRVGGLLAAGAAVHVIAPEVTPTVQSLADTGRVTWEARDYHGGDVAGAWYVVSAAADPLVDARVMAEAEQRHVFCERPDVPDAGSAVPVRAGHEPASTDAGELAGTVALVGGGPGADDLLTLRGRRLLERADVVVADRLAPQGPLAELGAGVEVVDAAKIPYGRSMAQEAINEVLVDRARRGLFVVRLKGGDPFLFGRGYEEALACAEAGVPCTVVPGVTSALAVPALGGMPVTHRGVTHDLTVVSGHVPPGHAQSLVDWDALGRMRGTLVLLMAVKNAPRIAEALVAAGRDPATPTAVVVDGSLAGQTTHRCTLAGLADTLDREGVRPPAILVIGDVAGLPEALSEAPAPL